jgi:hypothetical protein
MDVTILGIPDGISKEQILEWIGVLVERKYNADIQKIPELVSAQEKAKTDIDAYRVANSLSAKYAPKEEPKEGEVTP